MIVFIVLLFHVHTDIAFPWKMQLSYDGSKADGSDK